MSIDWLFNLERDMKIVQLVIMAMAAIFAMSAISADARLNHQLVLQAMGINTVSSHPGGEKWCDNCICNKKNPPECWCRDVGLKECYDACDICITFGYPPQYLCLDIKDYCVYDVALPENNNLDQV